jgi:hypothetical protein
MKFTRRRVLSVSASSTAVGLGVRALTPWAPGEEFVYLSYDGNSGTMRPRGVAEQVRGTVCPHHPPGEVGDPFFDGANTIA